MDALVQDNIANLKEAGVEMIMPAGGGAPVPYLPPTPAYPPAPVVPNNPAYQPAVPGRISTKTQRDNVFWRYFHARKHKFGQKSKINLNPSSRISRYASCQSI